MDYEITEVVKEIRYCFPDLNYLKVKARILKYGKADTFGVELSHWTKRNGDSDFYAPQWLADSISMAERRLEEYMNDFTHEYTINPNF